MDMSGSLEVLVRQDVRPSMARTTPDPMGEVVRQTRERMASAFTGRHIVARRKSA
jgi:hypothetical protein